MLQPFKTKTTLNAHLHQECTPEWSHGLLYKLENRKTLHIYLSGHMCT